jgi:transposase-like protein
MRGYPQWRWHMDEVFVKINGRLCYLWRAVDHKGEVLEAVVTAKRDKAAALKLLKRSMKKYGPPRTVVTDGLRAYSAAMSERLATPIVRRSAAALTIGRRIRTSRFGDANGRGRGFAA